MKSSASESVENGCFNLERHVVKQGLDWISKTWTGLVKHGLVKHGLVKHGLVKHGLVKHGLTWCFFLR